MSVKAMTLVWENEALPATDKMVLLSLADHADEDGHCYPSVPRLMRRTGLGERTVQSAVKRLEETGYLTVELNAGKRGSNLYTLHLTPAGAAPPQERHPARDAGIPPQEMRETPAGAAPEPSGTVIQSPKKCSFPEFWKVWPNKVGKHNAERAWKKLTSGDRERALSLAASFFAKWRAANASASPIHAATYLNQKRWTDYEPEVAASAEDRDAQIAKMLASPIAAVREAAQKMQEATQ